jgi:hypothetical protein
MVFRFSLCQCERIRGAKKHRRSAVFLQNIIKSAELFQNNTRNLLRFLRLFAPPWDENVNWRQIVSFFICCVQCSSSAESCVQLSQDRPCEPRSICCAPPPAAAPMVVVHMHEWMAGVALIMLRQVELTVITVPAVSAASPS